jgi:hypothetical protein
MDLDVYPEPVPPNRNLRAQTVLVPRGANSLLLCRYLGVNHPLRVVGTLAGSRTIQAVSTTAGLTRQFNALPQAPRFGHGCPAGDGSFILAFFRYKAAPADPVRVDVDGCRAVTNGFLKRRAVFPRGAHLIAELRQLTA